MWNKLTCFDRWWHRPLSPPSERNMKTKFATLGLPQQPFMQHLFFLRAQRGRTRHCWNLGGRRFLFEYRNGSFSLQLRASLVDIDDGKHERPLDGASQPVGGRTMLPAVSGLAGAIRKAADTERHFGGSAGER